VCSVLQKAIHVDCVSGGTVRVVEWWTILSPYWERLGSSGLPDRSQRIVRNSHHLYSPCSSNRSLNRAALRVEY